MLPVITLVGRPNVGKSTLFNRLTHTRDALVSDFPGMTRDRQYGEIAIHDLRFLLIDTGGISEEANEKTPIAQLAEHQSREAIAEADYLVFVVDARAGILPDDLQLARELRKQKNCPIILVVNKAENTEEALTAAEFYALGLGEPQLISAAHGRGIAELEGVIANLEKQKRELVAASLIAENAENPLNQKENDSIRLAIVGRPNVGKSTLVNRLLGEERVIVFDAPGTTRDSIFIPLQRFDQHYTLIDTAGVRRRGKVFEAIEKFSVVKTLQAIEAAQVVLIVLDAREGVTEQDLRLIGFVLETGRALVIAMNKWDGMSEDQKNEARRMIDRRFDFIPFVRIHFISALHGTGVGNLFKPINEAYVSASKKLSTPQLTKILQDAVVKHAPPLIHGRRIRLRYAHSGGNFPPCIVVHGNQVDHLPADYRRYLAGVYQHRLKLMGTPVRIEVKGGDNPFREKKNTLTERQLKKKKRLMQHVKKR